MQRSLRVLRTSTGCAGHVHALAPVARALRDRGHDVRWAVGADGGDAVGAIGFEWSAAGLTTAARRDAAAGALGGLMQLPMDQRRGPLFAALFARAAAPVMREDLAPIIERVRPDVMLRETAELAAAPIAAARGIPLVTVAFSGVLPEPARGEVLDDLRPLWQAEGFGDPSWPDVYGQLYLHPRHGPRRRRRRAGTDPRPGRTDVAAGRPDHPAANSAGGLGHPAGAWPDVGSSLPSRVEPVPRWRSCRGLAGVSRCCQLVGGFAPPSRRGTTGSSGYCAAERMPTRSLVCSGLPAMPHSPLATSSMVTHVTGRITSPSTLTMASVSFSMIASFSAASKTPAMS
jgi:hypothetical protein